MGQSGVGKTTLINAVLGRGGLVPAGTTGSTTSCVLEIRGEATKQGFDVMMTYKASEEWTHFLEQCRGERSNVQNDALEAVCVHHFSLFGFC